MAVVKVSSGANAGKYAATNKDGVKQYFSSQSAATSYAKSSGSTKTSTPSVSSTGSAAQQLEAIKQEALKIQSQIYQGVDAGTIQSTSTKSGQEQLNDVVTQQKRFGLVDASYETPNISKATAPTSVASIPSPLDGYTAPQTTPPTGNVWDANAGLAGRKTQIEIMKQDELKREQERQKVDAENQKSWLSDLISPSQAREDAWDETGMDVEKHFAEQQKVIKEVEVLTQQYNDIVAAKDQQIAQTNDKMASMNFINNQTAQIERNAAPQLNRISANINAKAAMLEAQQGNFAQAQSYVNQAVQDATADNKFKMDMYSMMYEVNQDNFDRIDSIYSEAFKNQMGIATMEYEQQVREKEQIGDLLLKYPTAGIDIYNDSLEDALKKAGVVSQTSGTPVNSEIYTRALQVLNAQANLSDFTTTEQAKIRDAIWSMDMPGTFAPDLSTQRRQSLLPGVAESEWDSFRMSIAGPGAGRINSSLNLGELDFDSL